MQLIAPLAAGIRGAALGTAEIYRRGTSTRATLYSDFEGATTLPAGDVALDANGGTSVYAGEFVRVVVRDANGEIVRDFVSGQNADCTDYIGPSFTGVNYTSGEAGINQPVSIGDVLDKWVTSAGAPDFQVSYGGAPANISVVAAALSFQQNVVITVKSFSATGDGVTDDTAFINAALAFVVSAGGGILNFPPGTYKITSALTIANGVSLQGSGPASCSFVQATAGVAVLTIGATSNPSDISGFALVHQGAASAGVSEVDYPNGTKARFYNCVFGSSSRFTQHGITIATTTGAATECIVESCVFTCAVTGVRDLRTTAPTSPITVNNTKFFANTTGSWTAIGSAYFIADSCVIDNSTQSSGTSNGMEFRTDLPASSAFAVITGCVFTNPTAGTANGINLPAVIAATATFYEDHNTFGGSIAEPYGAMAITLASKGAQIKLGSRDSRTLNVTNNGNFTVRSDIYGTIIVTRTTSADTTITLTMVPEGTRGRIVVANRSGGTILAQTLAGAAGASDFPGGASGIIDGTGVLWEYVGVHGAAARHTLPIAEKVLAGIPFA